MRVLMTGMGLMGVMQQQEVCQHGAMQQLAVGLSVVLQDQSRMVATVGAGLMVRLMRALAAAAVAVAMMWPALAVAAFGLSVPTATTAATVAARGRLAVGGMSQVAESASKLAA